jgi:D-citramalate synthase
MLTDYTVRIPPGGKTDALCETIITWEINGKDMKTRGLDSDQTVSAIMATQKMLNMIGIPNNPKLTAQMPLVNA